MSRRYLVDKSALERWKFPPAAEVLDELSDRALLCVCGPVEMEVMFSARNGGEADRLRRWLVGFDYLPMPDEVWDTAKSTQQQAVHGGHHRALSMADLLIAATAQRHDVTVLHYDGDFDMIAAITGQSTRWVAEPGSAG